MKDVCGSILFLIMGIFLWIIRLPADMFNEIRRLFRKEERSEFLLNIFVTTLLCIIVLVFPLFYALWIGINAGLLIVILVYIALWFLIITKSAAVIPVLCLLFVLIYKFLYGKETPKRERYKYRSTENAYFKGFGWKENHYGGKNGTYSGSACNVFSGLNMDEAKRKYRQLMKELHPDNNDAADTEECSRINAAYEEYKKYTYKQ